MPSLPLVLSSLFLLSLLASAQIVLPANSTLLDATQNSELHDANLTKAYISILQTHPQLQSYYISSVTSTVVNTTGTDYYITLRGSGNSTILVVVSLEENVSSFFVSYIKIDPNTQQPLSTSTAIPKQPIEAAMTNNQQSSQAILADINPNIPNLSYRAQSIRPLGGFRPLSNLNDIKFAIALNFLQHRHSNLINYQLQTVLYQVVTGVNFQIHYVGLDSITKINATVFVGFDGVPSEAEFTILCVESPILECTSDMANELYNGNELVINRHPELKSYLITSIFIEQKTSSETTFMSTFENRQLALRAIAEVMVSASKSVKVLSYYSYRYQ